MMITETNEYRRLICSTCAVIYFFPEKWCAEAANEKRCWNCPNGHRQHFIGETEAERLRRERDRLTQRLAERDDEIRRQRELREATERRLSATRGQVTKIKNRVGHGVCPCCNRTFENLKRHMASKHPTFTAEAAE
jgi:hypothetical protein